MSSGIFYLSNEVIQNKINERYAATGERQELYQVILSCMEEGETLEHSTNKELYPRLRTCDEATYLQLYRQICTEHQRAVVVYKAQHPDVPSIRVPGYRAPHERIINIYTEDLFYHVRSWPHAHDDMFQLLYVFAGTCHLNFEGTRLLLQQGDYCILSPDSLHEVWIDGPDDHVIQQFIYTEHFYSAFFHTLEGDSIISDFFKMILANREVHNYLLFSTKDSPLLRQLARNLYLEQFTYDEYSPSCTLNWMQLFFSYVLREGIESYQISSNCTYIDLIPVLAYLRENYKTTTLSEVAARFHYSVSYLSSYIKRGTGKNFKELIKELKMNEARDALLHTERTIEEIAALAGYHSADHFSRMFLAAYGMPPSAYRKEHRGTRTNDLREHTS